MREIQMMAALLVETLLHQLQNQLLLLVLPLPQCLPKILVSQKSFSTPIKENIFPFLPISVSAFDALPQVTLNYPDEFLTSISGSSTTGYTNRVSSITFGTNQGSHGPFGKPGKDDMEFNFQLGKYRPFGGFHGSTTIDGYLESIGVYVKPIASLSDLNSAGKVKKERI
ncbi:hypothetical protein ACSBR1_013937 [Camellia fascicularis]